MKKWGLVAGLTFFPFTAVLHHALFHRPTCILNNFGPEYTPPVVLLWLSQDPSPYIGVALAFSVWLIGKRWTTIQAWTAAFLLAFMPLTIWIWDIPFTGRIICHSFHDSRIPIGSRHLYIFGAALLYPLYWLLHRDRSGIKQKQPPSS